MIGEKSKLEAYEGANCGLICGSEFIRESGIPGDEYLSDVSASSRMNSLSSNNAQLTESQQLCGSEFIRESGVSDDQYLSDVSSSSRMNSLPQDLPLPPG